MDLAAVLVFAATALAAPVLTWVAHIFITAARNRRAALTLRSEPLIFEGARFARLLNKDGVLLMGAGRVMSMTRRRIACRSDDGEMVRLTPREMVDAWPLWTDGTREDSPDLPPGARVPGVKR